MKLESMAIKPISFRLTTSLGFISMFFILSVSLYKEIHAQTYTSEGILVSADAGIRLVNGIRYAAGMVEAFYGQSWETVCLDRWDAYATMVACREFGFKSGQLLLNITREIDHSLLCFGNETSLLDCIHNGVDDHSCQHDAGIPLQCNYKYDIEFCDFNPNNCNFNADNTSTYQWKYSRGYPAKQHLDTSTQFWNEDYFMYVDSSKGTPGDDAQLSNETGIDIDKGSSILFQYYLHGDPSQMLNVFIGAGEKGQLALSKSGDEGRKWHLTCLRIEEPIKDLVITFEAVRGSGNTSIVAIDDIGISTKPCESEGVPCAFNVTQCGYKIIGSEVSPLSWFFTFPYIYGPSTDHTTNSTEGGFMAIFNEYSDEGDRTSLHSPIIQTNQNDKIEFYYYMAGSYPGNLQLEFISADPQVSNSKKMILWEESRHHGIGWNYGCVKLPQNQNGEIVFTAIVGTTKKLNIAIDDISVSQGPCKEHNTMNVTCTFSDPQSCKYRISRAGERTYIWKRWNWYSVFIPTFGTGPDVDVSGNKKGAYLYADSSYGNPGDSTTVTFPVVENTAVKYLRFWYYMYGETVGSLHLRYYSLRSSEEEWTMVGDQGKKWRSACTKITDGTNAFGLIAVRGSSHLGDIAIDNIRVSEQKCLHPVACDFRGGFCSYEIETNGYGYIWNLDKERPIPRDYLSHPVYCKDLRRYILRESVCDKVADCSDGSDELGCETGFMEIKPTNYGREVATSSLVSPKFNGQSSSSFKFLYQMYGADVNKLTILLRNLNNQTEELWSTNDNTITEWTVGCVNIPSVQDMRIAFMSTNGFGKRGVTRVVNVTYHQQKCPNLKLTCNFDHPSLCGYTVERESSQYRWIRAKTSPTADTGPGTDHTGSLGRGYFIYAESSLGRSGDKTNIQFPPFFSPPRHYLRFYYNMKGKDSGELQVIVDNVSSRTLRWSNAGESKSNWTMGCIDLKAGEYTTVIFTAIRGHGPLGDIAIDDVIVTPGLCSAESFACDFMNYFLCGYQTTYYGAAWKGFYKGSGVYVKVNSTSEENLMRSPIVNLSNSCVRVHYHVDSTLCSLHVYSNLEKRLVLAAVNKNDSMVGQFHTKKDQMFLQFKTKQEDSCEILLRRVEVTPGNCPAIHCPAGMVACKDQSYCIDKRRICNVQEDCLDGSDEIGCPKTIGCDFHRGCMCGYTSDEWLWTEDDTGFVYLSTAGYNSSLISPKQQVDDVCVRFSYRARNQFSLYVLAHYENDESNSSYTRWQLHFKHHELSWRVGQFFIPAGNVYLEFKAFVGQNSILQIDNIIFLKDYCPSLNCSNDNFLCGSREKCIRKTEKCNRFDECEDESDESNCPSSLDCDFEDSYACGYKFSKDWTLTTGRHNSVPLNDHTTGQPYGHYMTTTPFDHEGFVHLDTPEKKITSKTCLTFFYSFRGHSQFHIYDNNFLKLIIRPFPVNTWQKSQLQLEAGVHKLRFSVLLNSSDDKLALDSISTSIGSCPEFVCEENWKRCQLHDICIPHYKFCDDEEDCPNGFDEQNCRSYGSVRLVGGENFNQGYIEYNHDGKWYGVCARRWSSQRSRVVCRQLGYQGIGREPHNKKSGSVFTTIIYNVRCSGYERSLSKCRFRFCDGCNCPQNYWVDCSNTVCSSTQFECPVKRRDNWEIICLPKELSCDGQQDCPGGTDEENCHQCNYNEFQCLNKKCISTSQRCDGVIDCQDSSDEYHCFMHNGTSFFSLQDGTYQAVCESNLNKQEIANELCKAVGKINATIGKPVSSGKGIEFTRNESSKNTFLPGLSPNKVSSCNFLNVSCNGEECGTRGKILNDKLVEYEMSAFLGQWPWQAVFGGADGYCGGILIHPKYVLTNAFCLTDNETWTVTLGTIDKTSGGVKYETKRKIIQSEFSSHTKNGLALLELAKPVEITDYIRPVCLPSKSWVPNTECVSTGWGMSLGNNYPNNLKEVKVHLFSRDDCIRHFRDIDHATQCANTNKYHLGCVADIGGPLVCRNQHGHWEVVGVTSQEELRCNDMFPPITYIDVYSSLNWILQQLT